MTNEKIEVFIITPDAFKSKQEYMVIDNTIENLQQIVGGYVEDIRIATLNEKNIYLYADEDGLAKQKERSLLTEHGWIVGTCVMVKLNEDEDMVSLTEQDKKIIETYMQD